MAEELEKNIGSEEQEKNNPAKESDVDTASLKEMIRKLEAENGKLRQANTNASADASKWKKQYQEKLSDEERKKAEQDEQTTAIKLELEALRAERNVANHKAQLLSIGFEDAQAEETAKALNDGDTEKIFDGLRKFVASHDKALRENAFRSNPVLQGGASEKAVSKEQFAKMGYKERLEVLENYPDLYNEYTKK